MWDCHSCDPGSNPGPGAHKFIRFGLPIFLHVSNPPPRVNLRYTSCRKYTLSYRRMKHSRSGNIFSPWRLSLDPISYNYRSIYRALSRLVLYTWFPQSDKFDTVRPAVEV